MAERDQATQDPTNARLRRAEQTGQFARSRELAVAITWLGGIALLMTFGSMLWQSLSQFCQASWSGGDVTLSASKWLGTSFAAARSLFWSALFPILGGIAAIAGLAWSAQNGFRFFPHLASPDINRISPSGNLSRMFSSENLVSVMLGLVKFVVLMAVAGWVFLGDRETLTVLGRGPLAVQSQAMTDWLASVVQRLCLAAIVVGIADYGIRWQLNRRSLRMTDQEIRDEQRSMEPSPEIGARRRLMQRR